MAVQRDRITVFPPEGETVAVDILDTGVSIGIAHAERTTTRTLTLPATISARTSFYVPASSGPYSVSVKLDGKEIAGADGTAVTVSDFPAEVRTRINAAELGDVAGASGGSVPAGAPVIRAFPFAYDTPGLVTGHSVYTPVIGDILFDGWVQIDVAWDGTTPQMDFGTFDGIPNGWFSKGMVPIDLTLADVDPLGDGSTRSQPGGGVVGSDAAWNANFGYTSVDPFITRRVFPVVIDSAAPIKICVSTIGQTDGDDPGATQGAAVLYLVTATPVTA